MRATGREKEIDKKMRWIKSVQRKMASRAFWTLKSNTFFLKKKQRIEWLAQNNSKTENKCNIKTITCAVCSLRTTH